jgi:hypothetical protein
MGRAAKNIHPRMRQATPSKFFSMKINPEGASIGNFVHNMKSIPSGVNTIAKGALKLAKNLIKVKAKRSGPSRRRVSY